MSRWGVGLLWSDCFRDIGELEARGLRAVEPGSALMAAGALQGLPSIHPAAPDGRRICRSSPLGADYSRLYISAASIHPQHQHLNLHLHACANGLSDLCSLNVSEVKWVQIYAHRGPHGPVTRSVSTRSIPSRAVGVLSAATANTWPTTLP